jgi:predicted PurR-regulated permease PerM
MKKPSRKISVVIILSCMAVLLVAVFTVIYIIHSRNCQNIIGDGYAMGTDPKPIVIGNTCDK